MANPNTPVVASSNVPPPQANLPFVTPAGLLTTYGFQFCQVVWASIAGQGGITDLGVLGLPSAGLTSGTAESIGALLFDGASDTLTLSGAPDTFRGLEVSTDGIERWSIGADATPEGGGNSGSNLAITRYSDAGAVIDIPLSISRASGNMAALHDFSIGGALAVTAGATLGAALQIGGLQVVTIRQATAGYAPYGGQVVSNPPTQAQVQQTDDAVKAVSAALDALRTALITHGLIS